MSGTIVHPGLLDKLSGFFPATVTIQQNAPTRDDAGQPVEGWGNLAGHVDLPCRVSPSGGKEVKLENQTYTVSTHVILLKGHYPPIDASMQAVSGGQAYDILLVEHDGQGETTRLTVEVVT